MVTVSWAIATIYFT